MLISQKKEWGKFYLKNMEGKRVQSHKQEPQQM
jgi:hypothetical protein